VLIECYNDGSSAVLWDAPGEHPLNWTIGPGGPWNLQDSLSRVKARLEAP
jgi:hypothetical protein